MPEGACAAGPSGGFRSSSAAELSTHGKNSRAICRQRCHVLHELLDRVARFAGSGEHGTVAVRLNGKTENRVGDPPSPASVPRRDRGRSSACPAGRPHSSGGHRNSYPMRFTMVQTVSFAQRPPARINAERMHGIERFPVLADKERRDGALDGRDTPRRLRIARRDAVPDAPDVFPALPSHAIEERKLQIVVLSLSHRSLMLTMWRVSSHLYRSTIGNERKGILSPRHHVPAQRFIAGAAFRLESQRMSDFFRGQSRIREARRPGCRR